MKLERGRVVNAKKVTVTEVRELGIEDLEKLRVPRKPNAIQKLRDSHHRVARMVALGLRRETIVEQTGYGYQRISTLLGDPTFQNLVEVYRKDVNESFKENADPYITLATQNMMLAEQMINDQLTEAEAKGEDIPIRTLLSVARDGADRFGYGKKTTNVNVNVDFAARLEQATKRANEAKVINAKPNPTPEVSSRHGGEDSASSAEVRRRA